MTLTRVTPNSTPSADDGEGALADLLAALLAEFSAHRPDDDTAMIVAAGRAALSAHDGQFRRSGEPYITHPVAVATIVAELGLDSQTVAAALLHDAVEDTGLSLATIRETFGDGVANVVDGVTKLDRLQFDSKEAQQAATIRKMLVAMADDWRVLLIKLADRLHNMRTLAVMPEWKQRRTAQETFDVYAPLAHRLGVQQVRWQLEDLAFATLHPKRLRREIEQMVADRAPEREEYLERVLVHVRQRMNDMGVVADVTGRPKHLWSIYEKMVVRGNRVRRHQRPGGHQGRGRFRKGLLGCPWGHPRHLGTGSGPVQGLHQHPEIQHVPITAHHGDWIGRQARRGADPQHRPRCTAGPSMALPLATGATRKGSTTPRRWPGCSASWTWTARPMTRSSSSRRSNSTSNKTRSTSLPPKARSSPFRPVRRRSTSPMSSTPRWVTAASGPASTVGSSHSRPS